MVEAEIAKKSMDRLWELRKANREALKLITPGESGYDDLMGQLVGKTADTWERTAPRLTGSLASATRGQVPMPGTGQIYTDPSVKNPIFGGFPAVYGQYVHARQPWIAAVVGNHLPAHVSDMYGDLSERLHGVYTAS